MEILVQSAVSFGSADIRLVNEAIVTNATSGTVAVSDAGTAIVLQVGEDDIAGSINLFPASASSGKLSIVSADNDGDTVTTITNASQAGARTYTIPDAGADASFLMTDSYKTWWNIALGVVGEDTDGAGTNGAGMVKVYDCETTTWDDLSTSALLTGWTDDYQLTPDAGSEEVNDAFAIGFDTKFCEVAFDDLATGSGELATYSNDAGKWQYSTGAGAWSDLTVYDGTDEVAHDGKRPLVRAGAISFAPPSDWAVATYDGQEALLLLDLLKLRLLTRQTRTSLLL